VYQEKKQGEETKVNRKNRKIPHDENDCLEIVSPQASKRTKVDEEEIVKIERKDSTNGEGSESRSEESTGHDRRSLRESQSDADQVNDTN